MLGGKAIGARIEVWWPMDETWFACGPSSLHSGVHACHACMCSSCCMWALLGMGRSESGSKPGLWVHVDNI